MTEDTDADVIRGDRFSGGPARGFLSSLAADERLFDADLAVDRAHVVMLAEQGIIDESDAGTILTALREIETAGFDALPTAEDIHAAIETAVIDRVGPAGGRMHTARSRNDEVATCIRYRLRNDLLDVLTAVTDLRETIIDAASSHTDTVMPGYTHLQPAQPTTLAHWLASYESAMSRDTERLIDAYSRVNRSPLGAAAFAGTPFPIDRHRTEELLGFEGVIENAADATTGRDFLVESVGTLATVASSLSGLAEDGCLFANRGFLELHDDYSSTSSIMPQKKNPDTLELIRATAGDAGGALTSLLMTLKGLPRHYNRDLQRATPHLWTAVDDVHQAIRVMTGVLSTASWKVDVLAEAAGAGFSTATGVADRLALSGIPFRKAHEVVATATRQAEEPTPDIDRIVETAEEILGEALPPDVDRTQLEEALDPLENVKMRDSFGGPAPSVMEESLARAMDGLEEEQTTIAEYRQRITVAERGLNQAVSHYE